MTNSEDIALTQRLIKKDLALDEELPEQAPNLEELKKLLIPIINQLLDRDLNRLLTALYRIDVNEQKVKQILASGTPGKMADSIATMVIERELKKVETRRKYSS